VPSLRERPRLLALLLVLLLGAAIVVTRDHSAPTKPAPAVRGRVAPTRNLDVTREAAVRQLLDVRAAALQHRDRAAWMSTVYPAAKAFRSRQAAYFDDLAGVPFSSWTYQLDPNSEPPAGVDLDAKRGPGWWAPAVTLSYRVPGYDDAPTLEPERLTFVPWGGSWYVAADDDFAAAGQDTTRGLWDSAPVIVTRGQRCLVLGHRGSRAVMQRVADGLDAAVPRVTRIWGTGWAQRIVALVPSTQRELTHIVGGHGDYDQIAAVATAELSDANAGYHPVGDRIVVNPPNFAKLGSLGRRVVLTHEVTHVATRSASGPQTPTWLVEGFADYVGYSGVQVPYDLSASELKAAVRRRRLPTALPSDHDFDGRNPSLASVYEQAWLAVTYLASTYGQDGLLRFYRTVGRADAPPAAVADALASMWGTDLARVTAGWRGDLLARLR
jgi:hypothetical protein